jgi:hypothetical protein
MRAHGGLDGSRDAGSQSCNVRCEVSDVPVGRPVEDEMGRIDRFGLPAGAQRACGDEDA